MLPCHVTCCLASTDVLVALPCFFDLLLSPAVVAGKRTRDGLCDMLQAQHSINHHPEDRYLLRADQHSRLHLQGGAPSLLTALPAALCTCYLVDRPLAGSMLHVQRI